MERNSGTRVKPVDSSESAGLLGDHQAISTDVALTGSPGKPCKQSPTEALQLRTSDVCIVILGDVAIDFLAVNYQDTDGSKRNGVGCFGAEGQFSKAGPPSWRSQRQVQMLAMGSGAWLIENVMVTIGHWECNPHAIFCYWRPKGLNPSQPDRPNDGFYMRRTANPKDYLHTFTELDGFERIRDERDMCEHLCGSMRGTNSNAKSYRITSASPRYWGPKDPSALAPDKYKLRQRKKAGEARYRPNSNTEGEDAETRKALDAFRKRLVVIFDGGHGFRDGQDETQEKHRWQTEMDENVPKDNKFATSHILLILRPPFPKAEGQHPLFDHLIVNHADRTTVVVSADALRREGISISMSLSWERTAQDFADQIEKSPILRRVAMCRHLIVRFGLCGAIHCYRHSPQDSKRADVEWSLTLFYDPHFVEEEYPEQDPKQHGTMTGMTLLLGATVARAIANGWDKQPDDRELQQWVEVGIRTGLRNCRKLYCHGFGSSPDDLLRLETEDRWTDTLLDPNIENESRAGAPILQSKIRHNEVHWSLLNLKTDEVIVDLAQNIVRRGPDEALGKSEPQFPVARFRKHWVVEREEIESFRSIRNLLRDHREKKATMPLSIAVFGPPGSGKSRGVKQIVKSLSKSDDDIAFKTCNVAQLTRPDELTQALLPVRDFILDGKMAVVFFDEFDSKLGSDKLGWLKYFLPIMQDGEFKHGEGTFKTGGAVFVFAGGTSETYEKFCRKSANPVEDSDFKELKGPDFVSRLRGFVNIRGANRQSRDNEPDYDKAYMIRRAIMLRSLFEDYPMLFNNDKVLRIDDGVLRALLEVQKFEHGSRSLQAILQMSHLANANHFDASRLPSIDQLNMHVDARSFMSIVNS